MQICAIDNGYYDTKVKTHNKLFKFRSKIQSYNEEDVNNNTILEHNNKKYLIGHGKDTLEIKKTNNIIHKICTITSLAQVTDIVDEFNIIVALPMGHYLNKNFRDEYKDYIANPNTMHIKINNQEKYLTIKNIVIFMQSAAALYAYNPTQYQNKIIGIIDFGGLTVDGGIFHNLTPIPESIFSINAGTLILYNKIKTTLNKIKCLNIQDYEIPYLINTKNKDPIIQEVIDEHFQSIIREMRAHNWSIETIKMVGIGGGILKIKNVINNYISNLTISPNPIYDNVLGLYNIAKVVF